MPAPSWVSGLVHKKENKRTKSEKNGKINNAIWGVSSGNSEARKKKNLKLVVTSSERAGSKKTEPAQQQDICTW